jgi:hypothetical protein
MAIRTGKALGMAAVLACGLHAQYGGGTTGSGAAMETANGTAFNRNYHIGFERPEAWGLKYFASVSLLSGLPAPPQSEESHVGAVTLSLEMDWLPQLNAGQERIGFDGTAPEGLNKAPIFARPVIRVQLPHKFAVLAAAPPPFELFGIRTHLLALGVERPLVERGLWTVGWRGYGQVGSVKGAFTCPDSVLGSAPGLAGNPTNCVGQSADVATLRYAGSELEVSRKLRALPKIVPHAAVGGSFLDTAFQTHAPVVAGLDETRLWTRGGIFSTSGGVTYLASRRTAVTVDAFYTPLWVRREAGAPRTNDGLFNVRALLSYTFH